MCVHQRIALYNSYFYYDDDDYDDDDDYNDDDDDVYYYWTIFNTIAYPVALMCPVRLTESLKKLTVVIRVVEQRVSLDGAKFRPVLLPVTWHISLAGSHCTRFISVSIVQSVTVDCWHS